MTVQRAGIHGTQYVDRNDYELRCICQARGDRNTFVDGEGPYCMIIDREYNKIEIEDVGINSSTIEAIWLCSDQISVSKGSIINSGGHTYRAKNSPADQFDGWISVQLQKTCDC